MILKLARYEYMKTLDLTRLKPRTRKDFPSVGDDSVAITAVDPRPFCWE